MTTNPLADDFQKRLAGSGLFLIGVNLVPLIGVLFFGWDVFRIMSLFWFENVVIGVFGVARLMVAYDFFERRGARLFLPLFFLAHYGGFMFGHGVLLVSIFGGAKSSEGPLANLAAALTDSGGWMFVGAVFASHAWSFGNHVLKGRERLQLGTGKAMTLPYQRMAITHVALIIGGFLVQTLGEPTVGLLVLVLLKTTMDLRFHIREHRQLHPPRLVRDVNKDRAVV